MTLANSLADDSPVSNTEELIVSVVHLVVVDAGAALGNFVVLGSGVEVAGGSLVAI